MEKLHCNNDANENRPIGRIKINVDYIFALTCIAYTIEYSFHYSQFYIDSYPFYTKTYFFFATVSILIVSVGLISIFYQYTFQSIYLETVTDVRITFVHKCVQLITLLIRVKKKTDDSYLHLQL